MGCHEVIKDRKVLKGWSPETVKKHYGIKDNMWLLEVEPDSDGEPMYTHTLVENASVSYIRNWIPSIQKMVETVPPDYVASSRSGTRLLFNEKLGFHYTEKIS